MKTKLMHHDQRSQMRSRSLQPYVLCHLVNPKPVSIAGQANGSTHSSIDPPTSSSAGVSSVDAAAAGAAGSSASIERPSAIILLIRWAKSWGAVRVKPEVCESSAQGLSGCQGL